MQKGKSLMSLYDDLIAGKYIGNILLAEEGSQTTFFAWDLQFEDVPQAWRLVPGSFNSLAGPNPNGQNMASGYFVFQPVEPKYWSILGSGPYGLNFRSLLTDGLPEDVDLFSFEAADRKAGTVKVAWVVRSTYLADAPDGWVFGEGSPAVFRVGFPIYTQGVRSGLPSSIIWAGE
jgi:hypothetical protein